MWLLAVIVARPALETFRRRKRPLFPFCLILTR